mgnify:CR=1 FL=1
MNKINFFVMSVLFVMLLTGCTSRQVLNISEEPVPSFKSLSNEQVKGAIAKACTRRRWLVESATENEVIASIVVRGRHKAKISIPFTTQKFNINYVSSEGLNAKKGKIHRNYNRWVNNLRRTINQELGRL